MPFEEILGQERVVRVLRQALATGTTPHAYLFYGPRGVGRFETACALAKALFCAHREQDFCGACLDCRRIDQEKGEKKEGELRSHPDFLVLRPLVKVDEDRYEVDPERGYIRIHQVRELERWISVRGFQGGWRVCVFDGAEKLNPNAANALLKTLEEPPPQSLLILISSSRTELAPTIQSRCQPLYFQPVPEKEVEEFLAARLTRSPEELALLAALSEGSLGRAICMDPVWVFQERAEWLGRFLDFFGTRSRESLVDLAAELSGSERQLEVLDLLVSWYRDLAVFRGTGDPGRVLNRDLLAQVEAWSGRWDAPFLVGKLRIVQRAREDLAGTKLNARLVLERMFLDLLHGEYTAGPAGTPAPRG